MTRTLFLSLTVLAALTGVASAQAPAPVPAAPSPSPTPRPAPAPPQAGRPTPGTRPPGQPQPAPRVPRSYEQCNREAMARRYRGAERRHFVSRCQLGYGRRLFRRRGPAPS